jgi:hypothetical protein
MLSLSGLVISDKGKKFNDIDTCLLRIGGETVLLTTFFCIERLEDFPERKKFQKG